MEPSGVQRIRSFATYHKLHNAADGSPLVGANGLDQDNVNGSRVINFHTGTLDRITIVDGGGGGPGGRPANLVAPVSTGEAIFVREAGMWGTPRSLSPHECEHCGNCPRADEDAVRHFFRRQMCSRATI